MKTFRKPAAITAIVLAFALSVGACSTTSSEFEERDAQQEQDPPDTLERKNLKEKMRREERPNALRYVYLMTYGEIVGYYTIEGKVSSSGSQLEAELYAAKAYEDPSSNQEQRYVIDTMKDDGSFGPGDPGIFFFTTEGVMVETSLDYLTSDAPLPIDIPRWNQKAVEEDTK